MGWVRYSKILILNTLSTFEKQKGYMKNLKWLSISLFCNQSKWNKTLSCGVRPFIKEMQNKKLLSDYTVELNFVGGDNIRLALKSEYKYQKELALEAKSYFEPFLAKQKSYFPSNSNILFQAFPCNTCHYGLFSCLEFIEPSTGKYDFARTISDMILEFLCDNVLDNESIMTFAYYLHIDYLAHLGNIFPGVNLTALYVGHHNFWSETIDAGSFRDINLIEEKYNDNALIFSEIYEDIHKHLRLGKFSQLQWLNKWDNTVQCFLLDLTTSDYLNINQTIHQKIYNTINRQLGIVNIYTELLAYSISKQLLK